MSFSMHIKKNEDGTFDVTTGSPEMCPDLVVVSGHVESPDPDTKQVVDLTARVDGMVVSGSRREIKAY